MGYLLELACICFHMKPYVIKPKSPTSRHTSAFSRIYSKTSTRTFDDCSTTIRRSIVERSTNYPFVVNKAGKNADKDRKNVYKDRKNADIKSTGEVTYQSTPQYGLVTVNNYCKFQDITLAATAQQQTANIHPTVDQQQCKKDKKAKKEKNIPPISPTGDVEAIKRQQVSEQWRAAELDSFLKSAIC